MSEEDSQDTGPSKNSIQIFLRIRPVSKPASTLSFDIPEGRASFKIPRGLAGGLVNNLKEQYNFRFDGIFEPDCTQDQVFEAVGRPAVEATLQGFNATVFAYGQTGSGKTFTMTGGTERYSDRGIVPRAVALVFQSAEARTAHTFTIRISYMEIYNEIGYDLLGPGQAVGGFEDLPRVQAMEGEEGDVHLRNLGLHKAANEEDALNLLFLGDTNRAISTTSMNLASSRSHCIFTLHIESREVGGEIIRRSKLNLVDLAGSERVTRSKADGQNLKEAKYINLSLHYLEQVIVALQERSQGALRSHVPYRNSMMTTVLRDSLGGNTRTAMLATVNAAASSVEESVATCRFAQRVATVTNEAAVNEELDPWMVIARLQQEVQALKEDLRQARNDLGETAVQVSDDRPLTAEELGFIRTKVDAFLVAPAGAQLHMQLPSSRRSTAAAFSILRQIALESRARTAEPPKPQAQRDFSELKAQIAQRDREVAALTALLQRRAASESTRGQPSAQAGRLLPAREEVPRDREKEEFALFSRQYPPAAAIVTERRLLGEKCEAARQAGLQIQQSKARLAALKSEIEGARVRQAMLGSDSPRGTYQSESKAAASEASKLQEMLEVRRDFDEASEKLHGLKVEIEPLHRKLQSAQARMLAAFGEWRSNCTLDP